MILLRRSTSDSVNDMYSSFQNFLIMALIVCLVADSRSQISDCKQPSGANQRISSTNNSFAVRLYFLAYNRRQQTAHPSACNIDLHNFWLLLDPCSILHKYQTVKYLIIFYYKYFITSNASKILKQSGQSSIFVCSNIVLHELQIRFLFTISEAGSLLKSPRIKARTPLNSQKCPMPKKTGEQTKRRRNQQKRLR